MQVSSVSTRLRFRSVIAARRREGRPTRARRGDSAGHRERADRLGELVNHLGQRATTRTVEDLPASYRANREVRRLTPLEQAEHDTIVRILRAHEGNKAQAAKELGIGHDVVQPDPLSGH
ncbi:helix-turn-helix domain-containing protein [Actinopolymorpha pittospori]|uniref:helix-turn-helix domain-containing protein n=1 Tax=Actinopolymorpha pittospori TaxID=648752 RepID=UPI003CD0A8EE